MRPISKNHNHTYSKMTLEDVVTLVHGEVLCGSNLSEHEVVRIFASDLMSDVLTIKDTAGLLLMTGLSNLQSIRTCEMSDIQMMLVVRDKVVTDEMLELAEENDMIIVRTAFSLYKSAGILYGAGIAPIY